MLRSSSLLLSSTSPSTSLAAAAAAKFDTRSLLTTSNTSSSASANSNSSSNNNTLHPSSSLSSFDQQYILGNVYSESSGSNTQNNNNHQNQQQQQREEHNTHDATTITPEVNLLSTLARSSTKQWFSYVKSKQNNKSSDNGITTSEDSSLPQAKLKPRGDGGSVVPSTLLSASKRKTGIIELQHHQQQQLDDKIDTTLDSEAEINNREQQQEFISVLDSAVINPQLSPQRIVDDITKKVLLSPSSSGDSAPLKINDDHHATLLLRQLRRVSLFIENDMSSRHALGKEPHGWKSARNSILFHQDKHKLGKILKKLNVLEKQLESISSSPTSPSLLLLRTKLRKAALLRNHEEALRIIDQMISKRNKPSTTSSSTSPLTKKDFHLAMNACRVLRFDDSDHVKNNNNSITPQQPNFSQDEIRFQTCVKIYKKMMKYFASQNKNNNNSISVSPTTVALLAGAANLPKHAEMVHGMWKAMLLARTSSLIYASSALATTAAVVRSIGRCFRFDKIELLEAERRKIIYRVKQEQQEKEEESSNNSDDLESDLKNQSSSSSSSASSDIPPPVVFTFTLSPLEMIEIITRELLDALPNHQTHFNESSLLQCSIAIALADLGESRHLGQLMSKMYRKKSFATVSTARSSTIHDAQVSKDGFVNPFRITGHSKFGTSKTTRAATQVSCLPYEAALISGLNTITLNKAANVAGTSSTTTTGDHTSGISNNDNSKNHKEIAKLAILECLESLTQELSRRRSPPPSAINMIVSSLLLYSPLTAMSPADESVSSALQCCFVVAGIIKKFRLAYDAETLKLLLRAVECTALVSIAVDPDNSLEPATCLSLLKSAEMFIRNMVGVMMPTTTSPGERTSLLVTAVENEGTPTTTSSKKQFCFLLEEYTSLTFLMSLGLSIQYSLESSSSSDENEESHQTKMKKELKECLSFLATATATPSSLVANPRALVQDEIDLKKFFFSSSSSNSSKEKKTTIAIILGTFPIISHPSMRNDDADDQENKHALVRQAIQRVMNHRRRDPSSSDNDNGDDQKNQSTSYYYDKILIAEEVFYSNSNSSPIEDITTTASSLIVNDKNNINHHHQEVKFASPYVVSMLHSSVARDEILLSHQNDNKIEVIQIRDIVDDILRGGGGKTTKDDDNEGLSRFCKVHRDGLDNCPVLSDDLWAQPSVRSRPPTFSFLNSSSNKNKENTSPAEHSPYENFCKFLSKPLFENLMMDAGDVDTDVDIDAADHDSTKNSTSALLKEKKADELLKEVIQGWTL